MRTINDNEIEEVIEPEQQSAPAGGMRVLGDDEIEHIEEPSIVDKVRDTEIPLTPIYDPTIGDVADVASPILETVHDFGVGAAQGATMGAADEIGAVGMTAFEKLLSRIPGTGAHNSRQVDEQLKNQGFDVPEESLGDIYKTYQKGSEAAFKEAADRSPIANTIGDIGGSITTGIAAGKLLNTGAKAAPKILDIAKTDGKMKAGIELLKRGGTNAAKLAPAIAAEGAMRSEGNIIGGTDEEQAKVLDDTRDSLLMGIPAVIGMEGVSEVVAPVVKQKAGDIVDSVKEGASDFAQKNPFLRKVGIGYDIANKQNINPLSESGIKQLETEQIDNSTGLMNRIFQADEKLGKDVGNSLKQAEQQGIRIDVNESINRSQGGKTLDELYRQMDDIEANSSRGRQIFGKLAAERTGIATPGEAKVILDDIDAYIAKFKAIGIDKRTETDINALKNLMGIRKQLSEQMKDQIPAYRAATQRFEEFRRLVPETVMAGEIPGEVADIYMGNLRNVDKKLFEGVDNIAMNATAQGSGSVDKRKAFINTERGIGKFMQNDIARGGNQPFDGKAFLEDTKHFSDKAQFLRDAQTVKAPFASSKNIVDLVGQLGHGGFLAGSVVAGKSARKVSDISRKAYKLPAETLNKTADTLINTPGLQILGQALKDGLANGDQAKKNAALFSILQNPNARLLLQEDENEIEGN